MLDLHTSPSFPSFQRQSPSILLIVNSYHSAPAFQIPKLCCLLSCSLYLWVCNSNLYFSINGVSGGNKIRHLGSISDTCLEQSLSFYGFYYSVCSSRVFLIALFSGPFLLLYLFFLGDHIHSLGFNYVLYEYDSIICISSSEIFPEPQTIHLYTRLLHPGVLLGKSNTTCSKPNLFLSFKLVLSPAFLLLGNGVT